MVLSQPVSFLYNAQQASFSLERNNLNRPLILRELVSWRIKDSLNKLLEVTVVIVKNNVQLSDIYVERAVLVPAFGFDGIITSLVDIHDDTLEITIMEKAWHFTRRLYKIGDSLKEYNLVLVDPSSLTVFLQAILDSANTDMPFTWTLGDDIPATSDFDFDVKWKSYYEIFRLVAKNSANDVWFEGKKVFFGTKGKQIFLETDDRIYKKLQTKLDLDVYGNIVHVVGAKVGGVNVHANASNTVTDLQFTYERVVSNNNLKDQAAVDGVIDRLLTEFDTIAPDLTIDINQSTIHKYDMKSGDIIKIISNSPTQKVKGFFRLINVIIGSSKSSIKLQFSKTGQFLPRITDSLDILSAALIKIHDLELNS